MLLNLAAQGHSLFRSGGVGVAEAVAGGSRTMRVFPSGDRGQTRQASDTPVAAGVESAGNFTIALHDKDRGMIGGGDHKKPSK